VASRPMMKRILIWAEGTTETEWRRLGEQGVSLPRRWDLRGDSDRPGFERNSPGSGRPVEEPSGEDIDDDFQHRIRKESDDCYERSRHHELAVGDHRHLAFLASVASPSAPQTLIRAKSLPLTSARNFRTAAFTNALGAAGSSCRRAARKWWTPSRW